MIISWNVNGLASKIRSGGLRALLWKFRPRVLLLQETKCADISLDAAALFAEFGMVAVLHPCARPQYHGVAMVVRADERDAWTFANLRLEGHPDEGRIIVADGPLGTIVNVYTPNSGVQGLKQLAYRTEQWDPAFWEAMRALSARGAIFVIGDLNVAPHEHDVFAPARLAKSAGFTPKERESYGACVANDGWLNLFDVLHPTARGADRFTYYSDSSLFARKLGWRLDHAICNGSAWAAVADISVIRDPAVSTFDHMPLAVSLKTID